MEDNMGDLLENAADMLKLGRLHFLAGGVILYIAGTFLAYLFGYPIDIGRSLLGYMILFGAHLSVSYSNDRFDMDADRFNESSPFSGGSGVLLKRPELARASLIAALLLIFVSIVSAAAYMLIYGFDPLLVLFVVAGNALGWSYTSPPLRLAYRGMGEIATALAVGFLVSVFGFYIAASEIPVEYFLYGAPMLFYGITFIIDVQIPDMEADRKGGKRTFVTVMGREISFRAIALLNGVATLSMLTVWVFSGRDLPFSMLVIALLSILPLIASLPPLFERGLTRKNASKYSSAIMGSNFLFIILTDIYFFFLLL